MGSPDPRARPVTVALTGDVLVHTGVWETARRDAAARGESGLDFAPMFADVAPLVAGADLGICHLETPVSPPGGPFQNYPLFAAPPTVLDGLVATGYDACTTASNHSVDQGVEGLLRTLGALDARDLAHTGTFASRQASRRPLVLEVRGVRLGVISMTYGTNGMPVDVPYSVNLLDVPRALAQARALHRDGVDVVMVAIHAGSEYVHEPSDQQRQVFDALTRSPFVDFVYGHHAHVVQPFDRVNGKWVALRARQPRGPAVPGPSRHVPRHRRPGDAHRASGRDLPRRSAALRTHPDPGPDHDGSDPGARRPPGPARSRRSRLAAAVGSRGGPVHRRRDGSLGRGTSHPVRTLSAAGR